MREINAMLATVISAYYYHYLLNSIVVIIATVFAQFVLRFELKGNDVSFQTALCTASMMAKFRSHSSIRIIRRKSSRSWPKKSRC